MHVQRVITGFARRQHGVVARSQLLEAGLSPAVVDRLLKAERLQAVHRGVYLVGPVPPPWSREMAAILACGPAAAISHRSAAVLWELQPDAAPDLVEVTIPTGNRRRPGVRIRRIRTLRADEVTTHHSIAITTPERTLLDLASSIATRDLERALAEAFARRLTGVEKVRTMLEHHRRRRGSCRLSALLDAGQPALTRSQAEERFLALIRAARLDTPQTNSRVAEHEVDFVWRALRLVVEIDGWTYHSSPAAFERDRARDATLAAAGFRVMRVTWRQLMDEPEAVLVRVTRALLSAAGGPYGPPDRLSSRRARRALPGRSGPTA